jgi:hypothetical protein
VDTGRDVASLMSTSFVVGIKTTSADFASRSAVTSAPNHSAAARSGSSARCAYRFVVSGFVWPSTLPTISRFRPLDTRCEAWVWRLSCRRLLGEAAPELLESLQGACRAHRQETCRMFRPRQIPTSPRAVPWQVRTRANVLSASAWCVEGFIQTPRVRSMSDQEAERTSPIRAPVRS